MIDNFLASPNRVESGNNIMLDRQCRHIASVCSNYSFRPLDTLSGLILGPSSEYMARQFSAYLDNIAYSTSTGSELIMNAGPTPIQIKDSEIPLDDASIDLIILPEFDFGQKNNDLLINEVYRALKYDGFCYFRADNKGFGSLGHLKMITSNFWRHDYTSIIYQHPEQFQYEDQIDSKLWIGKLPRKVFSFAYPYLSFWVWVLTKRK